MPLDGISYAQVVVGMIMITGIIDPVKVFRLSHSSPSSPLFASIAITQPSGMSDL